MHTISLSSIFIKIEIVYYRQNKHDRIWSNEKVRAVLTTPIKEFQHNIRKNQINLCN